MVNLRSHVCGVGDIISPVRTGGANGGTRTHDLPITNRLLYQLSHVSISLLPMPGEAFIAWGKVMMQQEGCFLTTSLLYHILLVFAISKAKTSLIIWRCVRPASPLLSKQESAARRILCHRWQSRYPYRCHRRLGYRRRSRQGPVLQRWPV